MMRREILRWVMTMDLEKQRPGNLLTFSTELQTMKKRDGCTGKIRHKSKIGAIIHIKKLKEPGMRFYRCQKCQGFHIGHANAADGFQARLDRLIGPDPATLRP